LSDDRPFEEREAGFSPPAQLAREEVSAQLRAAVWNVFRSNSVSGTTSGGEWVSDDWVKVLKAKWVYRDHRMIDDFPRYGTEAVDLLGKELKSAKFPQFYGTIEWLLRVRSQVITDRLRRGIEGALELSLSPYRLVDGDTLVPIASDLEAHALETALDDTAHAGLSGARTHLKSAAGHLASGGWADCVRESIHAVESVAVVLAPGSSELGPALRVLEKEGHLHGAMKVGFAALYGYASDEKGVRHALLEEGDAKVDEADALFMLSACASFTSYLISKGRASGLLGT
jgi:hypothetical protein